MSARRPADDRGVAHVEHVVPFHDVDLTARVWHGHYYKYFEMARSALFAAHDLEDAGLVPGRYALYVVETRCRHTGPLRYGDRLRASAWFRDTDHRLDIDYEITNLTLGETAARGHTRIAATDRDGRLLLRIPDAIRERIEKVRATA